MKTLTALTDAQRSIREVEQMAARMAHFPGREHVWAIERIRIIDDIFEDDAVVRRLTRAVLAGLELAEQRRRAVR